MDEFLNIANRNELADFLEIPRKLLTYVLYVKQTDSYYTSFEIPKKNGASRHINAPNGDLKHIQKKLADRLWEYQKTIWDRKKIKPNISHAFEKNKNIITNAQIHRNKRFVLNLDLENFFDSFHFGRVKGFFEKNSELKLPRDVAIVIAQLTCYNGCLPQGAPTSPIITNFICQILDMRLMKIAKKYKLDYTRYADDLTFSTNNNSFKEKYTDFQTDIKKEIEHSGFSINQSKTRLQFRDSKQKVTGLVVNKKINVDREYYKQTRAMAHKLYTSGKFTINDSEASMMQLEGRFSFINQLDWYNNKLDTISQHSFRTLNAREKQYQKFLFYKYFFANDKPLIVTEGKTDILYLKAALKSLYEEYPDLVQKNLAGDFEFKVSFLKKTERLNYFLGVNTDGADTMKNIYNYFSPTAGGKNIYPNYWDYFTDICNGTAKNPIILIFDNEINNNKKPLHGFANHSKLDDTQKNNLKNNLYIKLIDNSNLYLVTHQLISGKTECEIEDLFDNDVLNTELNGKTFSKKDEFDLKKYYSKDIFSKYIFNNYKKIKFDAFKPILNALTTIVNSFEK